MNWKSGFCNADFRNFGTQSLHCRLGSKTKSNFRNPTLLQCCTGNNNFLFSLTLSWRRPLSYWNQSIDLQSKSMDWFLYDNGLRHESVKCCLLHKDIVLPRHTRFCIFVSSSTSRSIYVYIYLCFIYLIYFSIITFITINHIILLKQINLFFGHFYLSSVSGVAKLLATFLPILTWCCL